MYRHVDLAYWACDNEIVLESLTFPMTLTLSAMQVTIRRAGQQDLLAIMRLLADDPLSAGRGDIAQQADMPAFRDALNRISQDRSNDLIVVLDDNDVVAGTLQLTLIPGMARRGATRLLVEAVRVASEQRSAGLGSGIMGWVMNVAAPTLGADLIQLTSDTQRLDAHRFYRRLGFVDSHVGFKYEVLAPTVAAR